MIDIWWAVLALAIGFISGVAFTLVAAAFLAHRPMDGRHYTGDIGLLNEDDIDELITDLDKHRHDR